MRKQALLQMVLSIYVISALMEFWENALLVTLSLMVGIFFLFYFWHETRDVTAFVVASLLGLIAEVICVKNGLWEYHCTKVIGIPIWLPLVWGYLLVLFIRISATLHGLLSRIAQRGHSFLKPLVLSLLGFLILIYVVVVVCAVYWKFGVVYLIFMGIVVYFWHREQDILVFWVGAILGTLGEFLFIRWGAWSYSCPVFSSIGLPISLPLAWGLVSVMIRRVSIFPERMKVAREIEIKGIKK